MASSKRAILFRSFQIELFFLFENWVFHTVISCLDKSWKRWNTALCAAWVGPAGSGHVYWAGGYSLKSHARSHKLEQPFNCYKLLWLRSGWDQLWLENCRDENNFLIYAKKILLEAKFDLIFLMSSWDKNVEVRVCFLTVLNLLLMFWSLNMFTASLTERKNSLRIFYRHVEYQLWYHCNKHIKLRATGIIHSLCMQRLCTSLGVVPDNCKDVNYYAIIHQLKYLAAVLLSQIPRPLLGH